MKGYLDSDSSKWGSIVDGIPIIGGANSILDSDYDEIIIAITTEGDAVRDILVRSGVQASKVNMQYVNIYIQSRLNFLQDFAKIYEDDVSGYSVAEGGVFQGDFARAINYCFPNNTLYLFDTFEGFNTKDTSEEKYKGYSNAKSGRFSNTSEELVVSKLPYPDKVIMRRGYFPDTASGLEDLKFFFVNLDFDLYQPTLEGLRFFYPRLSSKGVILIHDFFTQIFHGVPQAIKDFEEEIGHKLVKLPIGDHCSLAIMKPS